VPNIESRYNQLKLGHPQVHRIRVPETLIGSIFKLLNGSLGRTPGDINAPIREVKTEIPVESADSVRNVRLVRVVMWAATIAAGLLQALAARFYISGDGNSYLDVASAYLRGDFPNAINAYWSPFYSWLIALVLWVFKPSGYWETTILHLLDFAGLLVALRAFEFFFHNFLEAKQNFDRPEGESFQLPLSVWWMLGYGLFGSATLEVLSMYPTSPDAWVCGVTFLSTGLILKISMRGGGLPYFGVLGFVLGLGYLTKAFYFPLAFVFIGTAWLTSQRLRKNLTGAVIALAAFTLVAGPFVFALSKAKHRFSYGDVGKIAYAEFMDWVQEPIFWEGGDGSGTPNHPARIILSSPRVYEFAEPIGGSYPMWYDPSYWKDGITPHFHLVNELKILRQSAGTFFLIFLTQLEYVVGLAALVFCNLQARERIAVTFRRQWFLWFPAAAACLGFASVLVEGRYVASFLIILWVASFASTLGSPSVAFRSVAVAVALAAVLMTGMKTLKYATSDALAIPKQVNENWEAAQKLKELGISPGDRVALIGVLAEQHWMRLANVKAVAELRYRDEQQFWTGDASLQGSVFTAFAATGSKIVVATHAPVTAVKEGWIRLGNTDYYARSLHAKP
jgi:hypothetical protein